MGIPKSREGAPGKESAQLENKLDKPDIGEWREIVKRKAREHYDAQERAAEAGDVEACKISYRERLEFSVFSCILTTPALAIDFDTDIISSPKIRRCIQAIKELGLTTETVEEIAQKVCYHLKENLRPLIIGAGRIHEDTGYFPDLVRELTETPIELDHFPLSRLLKFNPAEDKTALLGNRYLCKSGAALIVGRSDAGKSSFALQMAVSWALGRPFFGIRPTRPLSFLFIQAENDEGDVAEAFQGIVEGMGINLTDGTTLRALEDRLEIRRDVCRTGGAFVSYVGGILKERPRDIVIADPLLSFLGGDVSDQKTISEFCRNMVNPLLVKTGAAWIFTHHTGKPPKEKGSDNDASYMGIGSSELVNWARAVMVLQRQETGDEQRIYKLMLAKRGKRAGVATDTGQPTTSLYVQHSTKGIAWEESDWTPPARERRGTTTSFTEVYSASDMRKHYDPLLPWKRNVHRISEALGCSAKTVERRRREIESDS